MKPVLAWVKSNPLIVVFGALILVLLPASWFGASWWSNKIRTSQEKAAGEQWTKVNNLNVEYSVKMYEPGAAPLSMKQVPNRALIRWFKEQGDVLAKQSGDLVKRAEDFNKGVGAEAGAVGRTEHTPLVAGLFPPPTNKDDERNKLNEMEDALLGHKGRPDPYQQMLDAARAGPPADPVQMADIITGLQASEKEKVTANKRDLTADEQAALLKELADRRLAEYQAHVSALSVYATVESLPHEMGRGAIPTGAHLEATQIEPVRFFEYQWNLWLLQDLVSAVKLANTGSDGRLTNVDRSVVKRIVSIDIDPPDGLDSGEDADRVRRGELSGASAAPQAAVPGMIPLDLGRSITGAAWRGRQHAAVRRAPGPHDGHRFFGASSGVPGGHPAHQLHVCD